MDVRCEKCHTEYELEESKVTEAGVTVKCTSCGNLFKIKRKTASPPPRPQEPAPTESGGMWLIRSPGGEARRFKELTTLQQWIVERKVTRDAELSRTGETWKKLGDIAELASFFAIVDQAQANSARPPSSSSSGERKTTDPIPPPTVAPARAPSISATKSSEPFSDEEEEKDFGRGIGHADTLYATQPVPLAEAPAPRPTPAPRPAPTPTAPAAREPDRPQMAKTAVVKKPKERRESWIGAAVNPDESDPSWANSGPTGGDPASQRTVRVEPSPFAPDEFGDYELGRREARRKSNGFLWIVAVILAGGAAAAYFLFFRAAPVPAVTAADAGVKVATTAADAATASVDAQKLLDAAARLNEDTDEGYAAAAKILDGAHVADPAQDARFRALEALVDTTASQALADDAASADVDKKDPAQLRAEAERHLVRAAKIARDAAGKAPNDPDVAVALADVLRLEKKPAADVERALAPAGDKPEALYVKAMLRARDGKDAEAADLLGQAVAAKAKEGSELLRARYRLAVLAANQKKPDDARRELDAVLAAAPGHTRAKALRARLETAVAAKPPEPEPDTTKPPPPIKLSPTAVPGKPERGRPASPGGDELMTGRVTAAAYDGLIARGNKLAENSDCTGAMKAFERALEARPGGVEALTGIGYCYLDRKQYGQALSNFRAALGISSRNNEALIGMAEAYRYQGMNKDALTYYRRYLDAAPGGPKAAMARRHVEELGGSDEAPKPTPPVVAPSPSPPPLPAVPVTATPLDKLPDRPGGDAAKPAPPASAPPLDKLPDKPGASEKPEKPVEKPAEPPPPPPPAPEPSAGEPAAPDTAR